MIEELFALKSPSKVYKSHIESEVNELDKPTFNRIELKAGARVIVLVNDVDENQYHNGSLATVTDLNDESVKVALNNGDVGEIGVYV